MLMTKHYYCACGWKTKSETREELLHKIRKHAEEEHPNIPYDESKIFRFIRDTRAH
jgi:predicted small metal-binding protein